MKINETTYAVVGTDNRVSGNGEEASIGYAKPEYAGEDVAACDNAWPEFAPHRVVALRLVEVDTHERSEHERV